MYKDVAFSLAHTQITCRLITTISGRHKVFAHVGFAPTTLSAVENRVATA